ncbi:hypothetical protein ACHAXT_010592 [Thalassiosira profunda]
MPALSPAPHPAAAAFAAAALSVVDGTFRGAHSEAGVHQTRAFYRDSSGRAGVRLRVRLAASPDASGGLGALLDCGCIRPAPVESAGTISAAGANVVSDDDGEGHDEGTNADAEEERWRDELATIGRAMEGAARKQSGWGTDTTFAFECSMAPPSSDGSVGAPAWALEGVTIRRADIERSSPDPKAPIAALLFDVEVAVSGRGAARAEVDGTFAERPEEGRLELRAVLRQKPTRRKEEGDASDGRATKSSAVTSLRGGNKGAGVAAGLLGLERGGGALSPKTTARGSASANAKNATETHYDVTIQRTAPLRIHATLVPPLQLSVREVPGARAASGSTMVEVTVEHSSRWHGEDVTVTGIAFHPGQSRLWRPGNPDGGEIDGSGEGINVASRCKSLPGGELSVIDMSRRVRWGFAPGASPELPLVLGPHEAWATVVQIDAGEDVRSRAFVSPISVNAVVGEATKSNRGESEDSNERGGERVMVTTDARWTSSRVGTEHSDAFRVDLSLRGGRDAPARRRVGAPLAVQLRVLNLSAEPRDLMLLMAKDGEGANSGLKWERPKRAAGRGRAGRRGADRGKPRVQPQPAAQENRSFNTAVVSEVNGYTFGVWGLSGDDDGTTRHHRDHELLAVDAALLLGEVKGQHSIEAELRFVPLREGTLDVPNLKLYDKRGMRWYNCVHTLKIVARQGEEAE